MNAYTILDVAIYAIPAALAVVALYLILSVRLRQIGAKHRRPPLRAIVELDEAASRYGKKALEAELSGNPIAARINRQAAAELKTAAADLMNNTSYTELPDGGPV